MEVATSGCQTGATRQPPLCQTAAAWPRACRPHATWCKPLNLCPTKTLNSIESKDLVPGAEEESVVGLRFFLYQVCVLPVSVEQTRGSICGDSDEDLNLLNFLDTSEPRTVFQPAYDMNLLKTWFWCNLNPPKPRAHATRTRHAHTPRAHATGRPCARHAHTPRAHATLPLRTPRACHGNATTIPGAQYSRGFTHDTHSHRGTGSR